MELKPGYRQSEIGAIPEDWEVEAISQLAVITTGARNTQDREKNGLYPFFVRSQTVERINSWSFDGEAVLTAGDGVGTGRVFHYINGKFDVHQRVYRISDFSPRMVGYFFFLYFSSHFYNRIMQMTAKSSVDSVRMEMIAGMQVPVPPTTHEQSAIATALGDVDALLAAQDALIAKKRAIKQGAMQELLTGKRRLPGFTGKWEVRRLGEIFQIWVSTSKSAFIVENGDSWICDMGSVSVDGKLIVSKQTNFCGDYLMSGDLIMPKDDIGGGKIIGRVAFIDSDHKYISSDHIYLLRAQAGDPKFLSYSINSDRVNKELRKSVVGSAQLGLGRKNVMKQEIDFPPVEEQVAISRTLSDMATEISSLETQRAKTAQLKQGMMQALLTGRIRLV